jgi:hypothetical protein
MSQLIRRIFFISFVPLEKDERFFKYFKGIYSVEANYLSKTGRDLSPP